MGCVCGHTRVPTGMYVLPHIPFGSCLPPGGSVGWKENAGEMGMWYGEEEGLEAGVHVPRRTFSPGER